MTVRGPLKTDSSVASQLGARCVNVPEPVLQSAEFSKKYARPPSDSADALFGATVEGADALFGATAPPEEDTYDAKVRQWLRMYSKGGKALNKTLEVQEFLGLQAILDHAKNVDWPNQIHDYVHGTGKHVGLTAGKTDRR